MTPARASSTSSGRLFCASRSVLIRIASFLLLLGKPCLGLGLAKDTPDDHSLSVFVHLVEDTIVINAHPVRRNDSLDQTLDPRPALQGRVHGQDPSALIGDPSGIGGPQRPELIEGFDRILKIVGHRSFL